MLIVALLLPWNLYFGIGIPDSNTTLFAVLLAVTLLSLIAVALPRPGTRLTAFGSGSTSLICCWSLPSSASTCSRPSDSVAP